MIASLLLGVDPPQLETRVLVGTAELFGIAPGTARVAMSRMVVAGELESVDDGYRLASPALLARKVRQDQSRVGRVRWWRGSWRTAVVDVDARSAVDRAKLNVHGSSLAAGHPFAATGGRIVASTAKILAQRQANDPPAGRPARALISVCAAGGIGVAVVLEAVANDGAQS